MFKIFFEAVLGSRAYGTNTPESDYDYRGVGMQTSLDYYFGSKRFNQQTGEKGSDVTIYSLAKFFELAAKGNPNILEIFFQNNPDQIKTTTPTWEELIIPNRHLFLSKEVKHAYKGFAIAQYTRMKNHHSWLTNPPEEPVLENFFYKPLEKWESYKNIFMDYDIKKPENKKRIINFIDNFSNETLLKNIILIKFHGTNMNIRMRDKQTEKQGLLFDKEKYNKALGNYNSYVEKRKNRNAKRFELEEKYGYDTKHASHTIRLIDQAEEILLTKKIRLCIPERVLLWRDIRSGKVSFAEFEKLYKDRIDKLELWAEQSTLPEKPNYNKIEELLIEITKNNADL